MTGEGRRSPRRATGGGEQNIGETLSLPSVDRHSPAVNSPCCTPSAAWAWIDDLVSLTRQGDPDADRALLVAITHYLAIARYLEVGAGYDDPA